MTLSFFLSWNLAGSDREIWWERPAVRVTENQVSTMSGTKKKRAAPKRNMC